MEQQRQLDNAEQTAREKQLVLAIASLQQILQADSQWEPPPVQCPVAQQLNQLATAVTAYKEIVEEQHSELHNTCLSLEEHTQKLQATAEAQHSELVQLREERQTTRKQAIAYTQLEQVLGSDPLVSVQALQDNHQTLTQHSAAESTRHRRHCLQRNS